MRWGSADTFISDDPWGLRMGRPIANESFIQAMLQFGSYDFYDFYCTDENAARSFRAWLEENCPEQQKRDRIRTLLHAQVADNLRDLEYGCFHFGDFTSLMPHMAEARNRIARKPFPITGVTHSLDGMLMSTRYQQLVLSGLTEFDAVICTSNCAEQSVSKGLAWARDSLGLGENTSPVALKRIPLAIDQSLFHGPTKQEARARFELPQNLTIALSIGRFSLRQKTDWAPILHRVRSMREDGGLENVVIVIAGSGDENDIRILEQIIDKYDLTKSVICIPNFSPEIKPYLYAAADFYFSLVDNFQETFGLSILEGMAAGLPIICSEFNGYRELVEDNHTGFLVPTTWASDIPDMLMVTEGLVQPGPMRLYLSQMLAIDMDYFENSFRTLCTDTNLRNQMSLSARKYSEQFTWASIIVQYEKVWGELRQQMEKANWKAHSGSIRLKQEISHAYAHYVTHRLTPDTCLGITELGRTVLQEPNLLIRYEDIAALLSTKIEQKILWELISGNKTLGRLRETCRTALNVSAGSVDFHALWLLKHSAIRRAP